jgi:hypothetical protein
VPAVPLVAWLLARDVFVLVVLDLVDVDLVDVTEW